MVNEHDNQESSPDSEDQSAFGDTAPPVMEPGGGLELNKDARTWAMVAHLLGIFTGFIGPLVVWLVKKDEHPFVDDQGKEALNFQITLIIGYLISGAATMICVGFLLLPALVVLQIVFGIIGTMKANEGVYYRYPLNIRFIT